MNTLETYLAAKADLKAVEEQWNSYNGNNPDKFKSQLSDAITKVLDIETELKNSGVLERSPEEELTHQLDKAFPNAQSKEVVFWNGQKYVRRFAPAVTSRSGKTVRQWDKWWEPVREKS
jgi:hypothetical protein